MVIWPDSRWIGYGLLISAAFLLVWGIKLDEKHWWHQFLRQKNDRKGVLPLSLDDSIRYLGRDSAFSRTLDSADPDFSIFIADAIYSALVNGDIRSRGRYFHLLQGGIKSPPLHPKKDIPKEFWENRHINAWWALNDTCQRVNGRSVSSVIPAELSRYPADGTYDGMHDIELDRARVEMIWPRVNREK